MKKPVYIRCPRCEINFIQKKDKLCPVCKADMEARKDYVDDLDLELCPICKTNYIQPDEPMCASCLKEHQVDDSDMSSDWDNYLTSDDDMDDVSGGDDDFGDGVSVNDITKSSLLDDDGIGADIDFGADEDISFEDEESEDEEDSDDEDEDSDDDFDDDFDDSDDDYDDDED